MKKHVTSLEEIANNAIRKRLEKEEKIFRTALRIMAEPPIRGEITTGKIRWRGIRVIVQIEGLKQTKWLDQRGRRISPKLVYDVGLDSKNKFF